jgi:hypothetical protein
VAARNLPDRVDHRNDDQSEGDRDEAEIGTRERCLRTALEQENRRDRPGPDEDEQPGADGLGAEALSERVFLHLRQPPSARRKPRGSFRWFPTAIGQERHSA